jgi:hypothetical protein
MSDIDIDELERSAIRRLDEGLASFPYYRPQDVLALITALRQAHAERDQPNGGK